MQHLDEGTIHAWLDGALSSEESARVEQHSRQCAECAAMVADARGLIAGASRIVSALDVVPGGVIPKTKPPAPAPSGSLWRALHLTPFRAALAASLMVAAGSLFAVRQSADRGKADLAMDAAVPVAATATAPATSPPPSLRSEARPASQPVAASRQRAAEVSKDVPAKLEKAKVAADVAVSAPADTTRRMADSRESAARLAPAPSLAEQRLVVDSAAPKVAQTPGAAAGASADAGRGVAGGRARNELRRMPEPGLRAVTSTSLGFAASDDFSGCYRVNADSAIWPRPLPLRFSLQADTASPTRERVVRGLDGAGRVDSSLAGNWRPMGTGTVLVTMNSRDQQTLFSLTRGSGAVTAQRMDAMPVRAVPVIREACPR